MAQFTSSAMSQRERRRARARWRVVALLALVLLVVAALAFMFSQSASPAKKASVRSAPVAMTVTTELSSYARLYDTLPQMVQASDLVAVVTIGAPNSYNVPGGGIDSDWSATVVQVLIARGEANATGAAPLRSGAQIVLRQPGGTVGNHLDLVPDDPAMKSGDRYLVLLHQFGPGEYYTLGGPQGRLAIDAQGRLHAANAHLKLPDVADGDALAAVLQRVASAD